MQSLIVLFFESNADLEHGGSLGTNKDLKYTQFEEIQLNNCKETALNPRRLAVQCRTSVEEYLVSLGNLTCSTCWQ